MLFLRHSVIICLKYVCDVHGSAPDTAGELTALPRLHSRGRGFADPCIRLRVSALCERSPPPLYLYLYLYCRRIWTDAVDSWSFKVIHVGTPGKLGSYTWPWLYYHLCRALAYMYTLAKRYRRLMTAVQYSLLHSSVPGRRSVRIRSILWSMLSPTATHCI